MFREDTAERPPCGGDTGRTALLRRRHMSEVPIPVWSHCPGVRKWVILLGASARWAGVVRALRTGIIDRRTSSWTDPYLGVMPANREARDAFAELPSLVQCGEASMARLGLFQTTIELREV